QIYSQHEEIASVPIEQTARDVARAELFRLQQVVSDAARARGMVSEHGEVVSVGVSLREFVDALSKVEQMGGHALVQAVAVEDTNNTDWPLRIRLVVQSPS